MLPMLYKYISMYAVQTLCCVHVLHTGIGSVATPPNPVQKDYSVCEQSTQFVMVANLRTLSCAALLD